jgi:hypothetical protein
MGYVAHILSALASKSHQNRPPFFRVLKGIVITAISTLNFSPSQTEFGPDSGLGFFFPGKPPRRVGVSQKNDLA